MGVLKAVGVVSFRCRFPGGFQAALGSFFMTKHKNPRFTVSHFAVYLPPLSDQTTRQKGIKATVDDFCFLSNFNSNSLSVTLNECPLLLASIVLFALNECVLCIPYNRL